jgi:ATP-dependent Clp protease ATP-binding subunit ClpA
MRPLEKIQDIGVMFRDITELARLNKLSPVVGRQDQFEWLSYRLSCLIKPNVLLIGEPGVGKTSLIEGFADFSLRCNRVSLNDLRFLELSCGNLLANTQYRGDFENKVIELLQTVLDHPNIILFIDEAHALAQTGDVRGGGINALDMMKPYLLNNHARVILSTTPVESLELSRDPAFIRRFAILSIKPLSLENACKALVAHQKRFESYHAVLIDSSVMQFIQQEYIKNSYDLDAALDYLDFMCSRTKIFEKQTLRLEDIHEYESIKSAGH